MRFILILLVITTCSIEIIAQNDFVDSEKDLALYSDFLVNADGFTHRKFANDKFLGLIEETLRKDKSFEYPFDSLKWISKITAPDSSFRIFSWQLTVSNKKREYFGILQKKDGIIYELKDNKSGIRDLEYSVFSDSDWFGQIYYNLIGYPVGDSMGYIAFGYKLLGDFEKVKTAMPLSFENEEVIFGKEIFQDTTSGFKTLIALKTSAHAASSLNFDKDKDMIIYDHTIGLMLPDMKGKLHPTKVPDGSYHGYKWDGAHWQFIDKVFLNKLKEAPINHNHKEKGLFGDKK